MNYKTVEGQNHKTGRLLYLAKTFYDLSIRDEKDYLRIEESIKSNPDKRTEDKYYI